MGWRDAEVADFAGAAGAAILVAYGSGLGGGCPLPLAGELGSCPVAPPRRHRKVKGDYDPGLYRRRKEGERAFGRLKRFRQIFPRYDQRDQMDRGFVLLADSFEPLRRLFSGTTP